MSSSTQIGLACIVLIVAAIYVHRRFGLLGALITIVAGCAIAGRYVTPIRSALLAVVAVIEIPLNVIRNFAS